LADKYKYRAFISYSHSDEKWAAWLHKSLETYKVPKNIVGRETRMGEIPARLMPVFRDRDELPSATNLGELLTESLRASATQIVICSPAAAKSRWVNEEIITFKRLGRSDRIFCLIVDGEPWASNTRGQEDRECFPQALRFELGDDKELSDVQAEPIAADARIEGDGKTNARLKLISGMLGVGFDALKQREASRRHRRMLVFSTASLIGMAITSGLAITAYLARIEAEEQRNRAQIEAETARQTTQFMVGLFEVSDPSESLGNTITAREILDKGAARIEGELADQPEIQATLMDTMGTVYKSLGLYEPAVSLVGQALEKRVELFGRKHSEVLSSLHHLGEVQTLTADYENAEKNLREALQTRRELFGDASTEVADTLSDLAAVLTRQGQFADAEAPIRESLAIRRALYGDKHPDVAESIEALGLNIFDQGDFERAVSELRNSVAMRRELHGERHPQLAAAIGNLALVLADMGELEEAESLYREALAMQRELHHEAHPEVASALNNVGLVRAQRGDFLGAEAAYQDSLKISRELLGDEHPKTANTMFNIALVRYDRGDAEGAVEMMRETLRIRRRTLGANHPDVASSALNLGLWLTEAGEYSAAERLLDDGIEIREAVFGFDHPRVAVGRIAKANLLISTERYEEALSLAQSAKASLLSTLPEDHWLVAYAASAEGAALAELGSYPEAESLLLASLEPLKLAPIPGAVEQNRIRLAELYAGWGKPGEAARIRAAN